MLVLLLKIITGILIRNMTNNSLIIFIKNPEIGKVKTRLAKTIGNFKALEVYKFLQMRTRDVALNVPVNRLLYYAENINHQDNWKEDDFNKQLQTSGDLGAKMKDSFAFSFNQNSDKTIIIGSDCYDLSSEMIQEAFEALNQYDLVIGPANDGGYYLLGMSKLYADLFENVAWSTETVFAHTIEKANRLGLKVKVLEQLIDIDTEEDLKAVSFDMSLV